MLGFAVRRGSGGDYETVCSDGKRGVGGARIQGRSADPDALRLRSPSLDRRSPRRPDQAMRCRDLLTSQE